MRLTPSSVAPDTSVISSAVAIRVLLGTQSVSTAEPPSPSVSTMVTSAPSCAATSPDSYPPGPPPTITTRDGRGPWPHCVSRQGSHEAPVPTPAERRTIGRSTAPVPRPREARGRTRSSRPRPRGASPWPQRRTPRTPTRWRPTAGRRQPADRTPRPERAVIGVIPGCGRDVSRLLVPRGQSSSGTVAAPRRATWTPCGHASASGARPPPADAARSRTRSTRRTPSISRPAHRRRRPPCQKELAGLFARRALGRPGAAAAARSLIITTDR